jgi:type IV fimbrial biogenesis protein FimT
MLKLINHRGFTLIELMIVISIIAITAIAISPALKSMTANSVAERLLGELRLDLMFARNQAISLSRPMVVTPISNKWSNGWQVFDGATLLRQRGSDANPITEVGYIASNDFNNATPVAFDRRGRATATGDFTIDVVNCSGSREYTISINQIGQIVVVEGACIN